MIMTAIVPILDVDEFMQLFTMRQPGDLFIIGGGVSSTLQTTDNYAIMPTRTERSYYRGLSDGNCMRDIDDSIRTIRKMIATGNYKRVLFHAKEAEDVVPTPLDMYKKPLFAAGSAGYDVQLYITRRIYSIGTFVFLGT